MTKDEVNKANEVLVNISAVATQAIQHDARWHVSRIKGNNFIRDEVDEILRRAQVKIDDLICREKEKLLKRMER